MGALHVNAKFSIHDGKLDEFKNYQNRCIDAVKEKDTGTTEYDWYYNSDQSVCIVKETYRDSEAFLEHLGNVGENLGPMMGITQFSGEVYGNPSAEVKKAVDGLEITFYERKAGA